MVLRNGTGRVSKALEASEARRRVMARESLRRDLQVEETLASSDWVRYGNTSSAHWTRRASSFALQLQRFLGTLSLSSAITIACGCCAPVRIDGTKTSSSLS